MKTKEIQLNRRTPDEKEAYFVGKAIELQQNNKILRDALKGLKIRFGNYENPTITEIHVLKIAEKAIQQADDIKYGPSEENKKWLEDAEHKYCGHADDCPILEKHGDKTPDMCKCNAYTFRMFASKLREEYGMEQRYF